MIKELTVAEPADSKVQGSGFNRRNEKEITYAEWCAREAARLRAKGVFAEAIKGSNGLVAVYTADSASELDAARRALG